YDTAPGIPGPCLLRTDADIPALPSSTAIPNFGDADDLPAPLSLTTIPGSGRADDPGTILKEDLSAASAVGSHKLVIVGSLQPAALPAPSGDAGTRLSGTPDTLAVGSTTARAVEQSTALSAPLGNADTNQVDTLTTRSTERSVAATPSGKETVRHLREIASVGSPGRPWTANFRSECLCLPVVTDPVALQVDLEELRFTGDARDFTSVIASLQTMLHDAGYALFNLVPTWGRTLSPERLAAQDGQFMSDASFLVRRDDAMFQTLDPKVTSTFRVEEDGDTLMLTPEVQELLGVAMVTRLRLAHVRPRDWSDSDTSRPEPKRRCGSTDAPLSVPSWPGSDEATRVWGGPIPEVVGTSSFASGDAPMLTADENMSSAGGGSHGSPGVGPSAAMVGVYMTTAGTGTGQPYTAEQPTLYVPIAEYPPSQGARLPPHASPPTAPPIRGDGPGSSEEETKSDAPMTARDRKTHFTAAKITPWDPIKVGTVPIIASTLTKRLPIPPNFLFPFRNPLIRVPIPGTGYRSELITRANVLALMATEPWRMLGQRPSTPLTFDHNLHRRAATPLWRIAVSYVALEEDPMIAYWESTHYLEITSVMAAADSDLFTYHQDRRQRRIRAGESWRKLLGDVVLMMSAQWADIDILLDPYLLHLPTKQDRVRWYPGPVSRAANLTQPTANLPEPTDLITVLFECDQEDPWRNHYRDPGSAHSSLSIPRLVNKFNHPAAP
ncbi:hypothetical protein PHMEG_00020600, partial [Phytophthora megakarya]